MFSQTALMCLTHQTIETIKRPMQALVRQHAIQTWHCQSKQQKQNKEGDYYLD